MTRQGIETQMRVIAPPPDAVSAFLIECTRINRADQPLMLAPDVSPRFFADGQLVPATFARALPDVPELPVTLAPGAAHVSTHHAMISPRHTPQITGMGEVDLTCHLRIFTRPAGPATQDDSRPYDTTEARFQITLPVNRNGLDWLMTDYGTVSTFFSFGDQVFHCDEGSDGPALLAKAKAQDARAICRAQLLSGGRLYWSRYSNARAPAGDLLGLSDVFFRAGDQIRTSYGNAKIADPASFTALDTGLPSIFGTGDGGYRCSYGRDAGAAYYFSEDTSTTKAMALRGCKSPETLEPLGYAYARDADTAWFEGRRIAGSHGPSFELLNNCHARDRSGIWHLTKRLEDADPASFQILPGGRGAPLIGSSWARDETGFFDRGRRATAQDYEADLARRERRG